MSVRAGAESSIHAATPHTGGRVTPTTTAGFAAAADRRPLRAAAILGVLGVVYGDIGTSPLYALKASLGHFTGPGVGRPEVLGVLSLITWALVLTVTIKYVLLVMRADNNGEGGILALMAVRAARLHRQPDARLPRPGRASAAPACSSATASSRRPYRCCRPSRGSRSSHPSSSASCSPISVVVIIGLFAVQVRGTATIGRLFGPIMALWFVALAVLGAAQIVSPSRIARRAVAASTRPRCAASTAGWPSWRWARWCWLSPAPRRSTPTWAISARAPIRVAWSTFVLPVPAAQLFRPGRARAVRPGRAGEPVLPAGPRDDPAAARGARDRGDGDREPGADLRRLLHRPAVYADVVPAAHDGAPHQHDRGRPDLPAAGQRRPVRRRADPGIRLPQQ